MSNTPFAYAVCSVLHRSVEFKTNNGPLTLPRNSRLLISF